MEGAAHVFPLAIELIGGMGEAYVHMTEGEDEGGACSVRTTVFNGTSGTIVHRDSNCVWGAYGYRAHGEFRHDSPPLELEKLKEKSFVAIETGAMVGVEGYFKYNDYYGNEIAHLKFSIPWIWRKNTFEATFADGYWAGWIEGSASGSKVRRTVLICDEARAQVWKALSASQNGQPGVPPNPEEWDKDLINETSTFADLIMRMVLEADGKLFEPELDLCHKWKTVLLKRQAKAKS